MLVLDMSDPIPEPSGDKPMTEAETVLLNLVLDGAGPSERELRDLIARVLAERHTDKFAEYRMLWNAQRDARAALQAFADNLPRPLTFAWYDQCGKEWDAAHPEAKE